MRKKLVQWGLVAVSFFGLSTNKAKADNPEKMDKKEDSTEVVVKKVNDTLVVNDTSRVFLYNSLDTDKMAKDTIEYNTNGVRDTIRDYRQDTIRKNNIDSNILHLIQERNLQKAREAFNDIFVLIAYTENFHSVRYHCGARWTIGYGSTVLDNGKRVTKYQKKIDEERGKALVAYHVENHVYPYLKHIKRDLSKEQLAAICSFIYNTGGEFFTGLKKDGTPSTDRYGNPRDGSKFFQAINSGASTDECVQELLQSHTSAGKVAWGLFKRRWVEAAVYKNLINSNDMLSFRVRGLYLIDSKDIDRLYDFTEDDKKKITNYRIDRKERGATYLNFKFKLDKETVNWFKEFNTPEDGEKNVSSIVDNGTVVSIKQDARNKEHVKLEPIITEDIMRKVETLKVDTLEIKPINIENMKIQPNVIKGRGSRGR